MYIVVQFPSDFFVLGAFSRDPFVLDTLAYYSGYTSLVFAQPLIHRQVFRHEYASAPRITTPTSAGLLTMYQF